MNLNQVKFLTHIATLFFFFLNFSSNGSWQLAIMGGSGMEFKAFYVNISPHMDPGLSRKKYQSQILES